MINEFHPYEDNPKYICPICFSSKLYASRTCGSKECLAEWRDLLREDRLKALQRVDSKAKENIKLNEIESDKRIQEMRSNAVLKNLSGMQKAQ